MTEPSSFSDWSYLGPLLPKAAAFMIYTKRYCKQARGVKCQSNILPPNDIDARSRISV